ncbi:MAG: FAD-dependent oxidoreductase [Bryobacterales bacterium]|nr:FAD-dependent oxidoreductase [Bryobacterales bacterium]
MRIRSSLLRASNPKAWGETVLDTRQTTGAVDTTEAELLIVGAGICGLIAAREMARAGVPCILLDKGSRPGGRAATRPLDGELADYGAQYLELRNEATRPLLREWVDRGIVRPWGMRFPGEDAVTPLPGAFAGDAPSVSVSKHMVPGGMNQLPASLAEGLDLRLRKEVCRLKPEAEHWEVATRDNERFHARRLLLTCPIPQALRLLESSGIAVAASALELLGSIRYEPCFSMLAKLDGPSGVPCPGGMFVECFATVAWIRRAITKGCLPGTVFEYRRSDARILRKAF